MRVFASSRTVVGQALGDIRFPEGIVCSIAHVRRGDADLLPQPDLVLEVGDRVGLLANRSHAKAIRKFFGDSIRGTAELSFISIGIGAALGLLLGMIPLPIPGGGKMTLGLAALLLLALCLGKLRRTGPFVWTMPFSANLVLRNFGLTIFLAQVGIASGPKFFATVGATGLTFLIYAIVITLTLVLITTIFCHVDLPDAVRLCPIGVISGATGNPGHPCLREPRGADGSSRRRLRHDLSVHDDRKDPVHPDCGDSAHLMRPFPLNPNPAEDPMKIAVFSAQPYDRQFLDAANAAEGHELHYFEAALGPESVALAAGYRGGMHLRQRCRQRRRARSAPGRRDGLGGSAVHRVQQRRPGSRGTPWRQGRPRGRLLAPFGRRACRGAAARHQPEDASGLQPDAGLQFFSRRADGLRPARKDRCRGGYRQDRPRLRPHHAGLRMQRHRTRPVSVRGVRGAWRTVCGPR